MVHKGRISVFRKNGTVVQLVGESETTIYSDTDRWVTIITDDNPKCSVTSEMFTFNKVNPFSGRTDEIKYQTTIRCKKCSKSKNISHGNTGFENVDSTQNWTCSCGETSVCVIMEFQSSVGRLAANGDRLLDIAKKALTMM